MIVTQDLLIRYAKRKAPWDGSDVVHIRKVEFKSYNGDDSNRPSVYELQKHELVQGYAEHSAATPIHPEKSTYGVDFQNLAQYEVCPGLPEFSLIHQNHREMVIQRIQELEDLIAALLKDKNHRCHAVTKAEILEYIRGRLKQNDSEWKRMAESPKCLSWVKSCISSTDAEHS